MSTTTDNPVPFDVGAALRRIRAAVRPYPRAALFELADEGFSSPFEILVACIISIRTRDEVTLPTVRRLFALARTPDALRQLAVGEIDQAIRACTFHDNKARQIHRLARRVAEEFDGNLPCDRDVLLSFHGVGPKCAHLVLGVACGLPYLGVDVHVQRVTNRWGLVRAGTPEKTRAALEAAVPRRYWVELNKLLVPFGKHICTGVAPKCSTCPVRAECRRVGVTRSR